MGKFDLAHSPFWQNNLKSALQIPAMNALTGRLFFFQFFDEKDL